MLDIPVKIAMEVGSTQITIRNLLQLNQGSVIELERLAGEPLDVLVNGTLIAHGEVVVVNEKFGIRVTDVISPSERIKKVKMIAFILLFRFVVVLSLMVLSSLSLAKDQLDSAIHAAPVAKLEPIINTASVFQVLFSLLFVIAVIYLFAWYLRRHQSSGVLNQKMTVIAALSVGARERLVLVQLAEKQLLLGVSPGRVNLLQAYDQPIFDNQPCYPAKSFRKIISRIFEIFK